MQIDKNITELAHIASSEVVPMPDVSASVMNTLMNVRNADAGNPLRLWFMVASMAASFIMALLAYRMYSSNTFEGIVDIVSWAV